MGQVAEITEMFVFSMVDIGAQTWHLEQPGSAHGELLIYTHAKYDCSQTHAIAN